MSVILYLFAMYGIAFGIQHKLPNVWRGALKDTFKKGFLDSLLSCTYCVGFHSGWIVYVAYCIHEQSFPSLAGGFIFAFAGASFSYTIDAYVQNLEEGEEEYEDSEEE